MVAARYEVYLLGNGKPEMRLTDKPLKVGDVVEFGDHAWRVRSEDRGTNGVAARFICISARQRTKNPPARSARTQPPA
jgi:hypothetical protein